MSKPSFLWRFLTIPTCPPEWKAYNLYLIRDGEVAFYVGQSHCAFERVREHIQGGIKGHAVVGRFLLCNWPHSAHFTVELIYSGSQRFRSVQYNLNAAEEMLIRENRPCFNVSLNSQPEPLPAGYLPVNTPIKYLKSYRRMLREAGIIVHKESSLTEW